MASSLRSSYQMASDIEYDYCCTRCDEDNKNSEALFYCTNCCKLYCDPCVKLHAGFFKDHGVLDRKNVDKWGVVRIEVKMAMCDDHKGEELKMYCKDHDMVCCIICMSDDHRSCKNFQHVPDVAKGIHQMKDFKKLPSDVSTMIQQLSNMQDSREKTHQLLLHACQDIISYLNEQRKKLTKLMDEIQKRTLEQMNQLFAAMDVNIQSDKDTCKAKQIELTSLLEDLQAKGKKSETFAFSGFKKCRGKLSAAEGMLESMTKPDYKLNFTPDTSIEQRLSTMSTFGELTTSTPAAPTSPVKTDHVYTMVNKQKYNLKIKGDKHRCNIGGCCTLSNGNALIVDILNKKVKLLDNKYHVQAYFDVPAYPHDICRVSDNEVAVAVCDYFKEHEILFISTRNGTLVDTRCIRLIHECYGLVHHAGQLYVASRTALYIYTMAGQLVKKLYEDTSSSDSGSVMKKLTEYILGSDTVHMFAVSDDGRRVYIADSSHHSLITLDSTCNKKATLVDPDMKDPSGVQVSQDGSVFVCSHKSNTLIQVAADGKRKLATLLRQTDGIKKPLSLCLDRKSCTLIVGQKENDEILVLKIK